MINVIRLVTVLETTFWVNVIGICNHKIHLKHKAIKL